MHYLQPFVPLWVTPAVVGLVIVYISLVFEPRRKRVGWQLRITGYSVGLYALCMFCTCVWMYLVFEHWSWTEIAMERVVSALWQSLIPLGIGLIVQSIIWLAMLRGGSTA